MQFKRDPNNPSHIFFPASDKDTRAAMRKRHETDDPELWSRCYPRIYEPYNGNRYASPKSVAHRLFNAAIVHESNLGKLAEHNELLWASQNAELKTPLFWLTEDLGEAILRTEPPIRVHWASYELPFELMNIMLPRGLITHNTEGPIDFVSFCRQKKGAVYRNISRRTRVGTWERQNSVFMFFMGTEDVMTQWLINEDENPELNLQELDEISRQANSNVFESTWLNEHDNEEDTRVGALCANLCWGLILLLRQRPELLERSQMLRRVTRRGEQPREFWSPNVLGRNYRMRRESQGGTHASPRGHWVRGFFRDQRHGPGLSLVQKNKWIEPYWRGGDEEDTEAAAATA